MNPILLIAGIYVAQGMDSLMTKSLQGKNKLEEDKWYAWIATGDNPCPTCAAHDGKILQGKNISPFPPHAGCKCYLVELDQEALFSELLNGEAIEENGEIKFVSNDLTEIKKFVSLKQ